MALALYFATILSLHTRFRNLFKGILFFPYLINGVAIGMIFLYFFQPGGTLDAILAPSASTSLIQQWLGDPDIINFSLAGTSVWRYMGLNFVLFLGAIQSIHAAALRGRRARRRQPVAPVPVHHPAGDPADHRPVAHPRDLRLAVGLRDPVHHDGRRQRHGDLRHPDRQAWRSSSQGRPGLGDGRGPPAASC